MRPRAIITETLDPACADWLSRHTDVVWVRHDDEPALTKELADADALIVRTYTLVTAALLEKAPKLKVVARAGVGLDNIDLAACKAKQIPVVYTPDANTQAVVEYVFALLLDAIRPRESFSEPVTPQQFSAMRATNIGAQLNELTLGIVGFGRIGKRIGQVAHAIGMRVLVNDILPEAQLRSLVNYPFDFVDKPALYAAGDIVTIHVDGRSENRHLIDADALRQMKPTCIFMNAARGMLVDAAALAAWANANPNAEAILDVHDPEPPPHEQGRYPLYGLPNVRLLPHIASRTETALRNMSWVVRDVVAVLEGKTPEFPAW